MGKKTMRCEACNKARVLTDSSVQAEKRRHKPTPTCLACGGKLLSPSMLKKRKMREAVHKPVSGRRLCAMCGSPLSMYNRLRICALCQLRSRSAESALLLKEEPFVE